MSKSFILLAGVIVLALVGYSYFHYNADVRDQEMARSCSIAAREWHADQLKTQGTATIKIDPYFINHYNTEDGGCYATVLQDWMGVGTALLYSDFVYNVYENKMVLEDDTPSSQNLQELYVKYSSDAASSTQITKAEYDALYKFYLSS